MVALFLGILTTAGIAGFYAVAPDVYTARARATGIGWMIGLGRLVSIVAPILVGYLISGGWQPERIFFLFAIPLAASALCIVSLGISLKRTRAAGACRRRRRPHRRCLSSRTSPRPRKHPEKETPCLLLNPAPCSPPPPPGPTGPSPAWAVFLAGHRAQDGPALRRL